MCFKDPFFLCCVEGRGRLMSRFFYYRAPLVLCFGLLAPAGTPLCVTGTYHNVFGSIFLSGKLH